MIWVLVGVAVGVAIVLGRLPGLAPLADWVTATFVEVAASGAERVGGAVSGERKPEGPGLVVAAVLAVMTPGLAGMLMAVAVRGALTVKRTVAAVIAVAGVLAFWVLPWHQALAASVLLGLLATVVALATGPGLVTPIAAAGTVLAVSTVRVVFDGGYPGTVTDVAALDEAFTIGATNWQWLLSGVALVPFATAAYWMLGLERWSDQAVVPNRSPLSNDS